MTYLVAFTILTRCLLIQGNLEWKVLKKITEYGQNVTLVCNVSNCCPKSAGWDKYTPQQRTIIIDVKTWRPTKKYDGNILTDGYTLVIRNMTKQDLNISYSCVYGSSLGDKQYLLEENVFDYISTTHQNSPVDNRTFSDGNISTTQQNGLIGNQTFSAGKINPTGLADGHYNVTPSSSIRAGIIIGVSAAVLVVLFIICFWKRRKERHRNIRNSNSIEGSNEGVPLINPYLEEPNDIQCIEGEDAILTCKLKPNITAVKWLKNGKEITQIERCIMSTVDTQHTLTIKNTIESDSGDYYVQVGTFSKKIQLNITDPFLEEPIDIQCIEGEDAILTCKLRPNIPTLKWLKNGKEITQIDRCIMSTVDTEHTLTIKNTTESDSGDYHVQVGTFSKKIQLNITDPFLEEPIDIQCIEGEDAILTCKLRPNIPTLKWLKNGKEITQIERCIMSTVDTEHTLTIKNTTESDSGDYHVQVGTFSKKIQLKITELQMEISKDERNTYMEAIESGKEIRQYVRVQVIGKDRVGKTSLVRRLLYLEDGKYDGKSTDGIEINRKCHIRRNDGAWFVGEVDTQKEMMRRIGLAVDMKQAKTVTHLVEDTETTQNKQIPIASTKDIFQETENKLTDQEPLLSRQKNRETETLNVVPTIYDDTTFAGNTPAVTTNNEDANELSKDDKMMSQTHIDLKNAELTDDHVISADQITDLVIKKMDEIISSSKMDKEKKESGDLVECGIWDFAGQKDYYATHQTFFTPYAIYLLVVDIEDDIKPITHDEDDCTCIGDYVDFWFDSVHCFCKDHSADKLSPPVLMVCTGTDKFEKVKDRQTKYEDKFLDTVGKQTKFNHRRGIYFLSNTHFKKEDMDEINRLRKHISNIAFEMNYFAEKLPTKWIQLETVLEVLKEDSPIHVYSWDNLLKISHKNLVEEGELLAFLNYQHKIGNIIFFDDIREYIILRPEWLVKCFRCLVCDCNIEKRNYNLISPTTWNQLKISGELPETLIDQLFQKEPELKFADHKTHLLNVMEKFDIVIKPQFKDTSTDKCQKSDSYYLPCMIENSSSYKSILDTFIPKSSDVSITPWLVFEFEFLPFAYFNHILFYYIRKYEVCKVKALYRGKAVFYLDELSKFIICFSRNAVSVQIWRWDVLEDNVYQTILNELCDIIETIQGKLRHTISYSIKVKCRTGDFSKSEDRIPLKDVNDREVYFCNEHCIPHSMDDIRNSWFKHHDRYYKKPDQKGLVLIVDLSYGAIGYPSFGYDEDLQNLSNFFKEELKYQVEFSGNSMTKTELQNYFMEIDRTYLVENSQDYHSFICVIVGYENEDGIQTTDIPITIEEIHQIFKSTPGGKFNGKPKLFMFGLKYKQTVCRYKMSTLGVFEEIFDVQSFSSEIDADSLVAWSSKPDNISRFDVIDELPFIRVFVSIAKKKYRDEHVEDILSDVIRELETDPEYIDALEYVQKEKLTQIKSALTKKYFL